MSERWSHMETCVTTVVHLNCKRCIDASESGTVASKNNLTAPATKKKDKNKQYYNENVKKYGTTMKIWGNAVLYNVFNIAWRNTLLYNIYNMAFTAVESRYSSTTYCYVVTSFRSMLLRRCIIVSMLRSMTEIILTFRGIIQLNQQWQKQTCIHSTYYI